MSPSLTAIRVNHMTDQKERPPSQAHLTDGMITDNKNCCNLLHYNFYATTANYIISCHALPYSLYSSHTDLLLFLSHTRHITTFKSSKLLSLCMACSSRYSHGLIQGCAQTLKTDFLMNLSKLYLITLSLIKLYFSSKYL